MSNSTLIAIIIPVVLGGILVIAGSVVIYYYLKRRNNKTQNKFYSIDNAGRSFTTFSTSKDNSKRR